MLTRIEIDGFKSFEGFSVDLHPFAVILGSNASGKSNLFDAIQFLSRMAAEDIRSAARGLRGEARDFFRETSPGERADRIHLAVETLLDPDVEDPWGKRVELKHTRVRYEVTVARVRDDRGIDRLTVARESAVPVLSMRDGWRPYGRRSTEGFRSAHLRYGRRTAWLETVHHGGGRQEFRIHQDGVQGRTRAAQSAEATLLSSMTTADFPHLYALREELRSWRLLQLDPFTLRRPSALDSEELLRPDGANLAAVLHRIKAETQDSDSPRGILADIAGQVSAVIPGVIGVDVELNQSAREYRAHLRLRDGLEIPTSVASDGTLRVLALLTMLSDPRHRGTVCFEEPENGVHPARLRALMGHLRGLVTDPVADGGGREEPLSQLIMNSHSPVVLSALRDPETRGQVLFCDLVSVADPATGKVRRRTRMREIERVGPGKTDSLFGDEQQVAEYEVRRYLETADTEA